MSVPMGAIRSSKIQGT